MSERPNTQTQPNFMGRPGPGARFMTQKVTLGDVKGTLKKLGAYLLAKWPVLLIVFASAVVTTLVTIIGTRLNGYTVDTFIAQKDIAGLGRVCLVMIALYLVSVVSNYAQNLLMIGVAQHTSAALRRDLFSRMQGLPLSYYDTRSSGELMSRLTNDVDNINSALSQNVVQLFTSLVSIVGMLIAMCLLSPMLTLVCLVTTPLSFFLSKGIAKNAQRFFVRQQRSLGQMNGYIEEMVSGQKIIRLFSKEQRTQSAFDGINRELVSASFRAQAASGVLGPCNNMINNIAYLLVAVLGGVCIIQGVSGITVGVVFSFLLYMRSFTNPINNILSLANMLQLALASAERVFEVMEEPQEADAEDALPAQDIQGDIAFEKVDFSYVPEKPVLRSVDLAARPGQTIAIVGPTGSGKTTMINLLTRFYDADSGEVRLDGKPIGAYTRASLRRSVAMVLQDTFLFSDTIRENIRYGLVTATDEAVEAAARQAHAHEFIEQLPQGYDTVLSDNGQNLSQGQRQLLSIARAILSNASVLILDEATSSIDTRTELLIQNALLTLMEGKTSFVIAHRLSTIRGADNILVIDEGRVVEQGSHDALIAANGFYAKLYNSQFRTGMVI